MTQLGMEQLSVFVGRSYADVTVCVFPFWKHGLLVLARAIKSAPIYPQNLVTFKEVSIEIQAIDQDGVGLEIREKNQ